MANNDPTPRDPGDDMTDTTIDAGKMSRFAHAIDILRERECHLRAHIRKCNENSHEIMYSCGDPRNQKHLEQVRAAVAALTESEAANG